RIDVGLTGVEVVVPEGVDVDPEALLASKAEWVLDTEATYAERRARVPDRTFAPGEPFPFLGEDRELVVEPRRDHTVREETIRLRASAVERSSVRDALESCYRTAAREEFAARIDRWSERMGVDYDRLEVRNQRTRWGSCSTSGTISLNWRVVMAPPAIVDYLVVHELAHRREPHHGEAFWAVVAEYDPDYEAHAAWLEEHAAELVFTEADL
ncbi:MAG: M48 family metallopeptidase, partial [Halobacteriaceae archaeon]